MSDFKVGDRVVVSEGGEGTVTRVVAGWVQAELDGWSGPLWFERSRVSPAPTTAEQKPEPVFDFGARKRYVDPETGYEKDTSAYRFDLVPADALAELAKVYGTGEMKYPSGPEGPNWLSGGPLWPSRAALGRHLASYDLGQDVDPSDECYELAKVAWHAFGLLVYHLRGIGNDTRGRLKLINEGEVSQ